MDRLPLEILLLIFQELDDILPFVLLSQRYRGCVTTHWIYRNIVTHFPPYLQLFQAIGRACHVDTIKRLIQADPRCLTLELARSLHQRYTGTDPIASDHISCTGWGTTRHGVSPSTFAFVIEAGRRAGWTDNEISSKGSQTNAFTVWESLTLADEGITVGTTMSVDHILRLQLTPPEAHQWAWDELEHALER